jgi:hypothetical protein
MTPRTDVETRYDVRSDAGAAAPVPGRGVPGASRWDRRTARVSWSHVLPLAVVLAFANGFWIVTLRGAVGAIERTSAPFSTWVRESTLLVPVYVVAVLAAFMLAQRWFGPRPRGMRANAATIGLVAGCATAAGVVLQMASGWFDFLLQRGDLRHMGSMHMTCDATCTTERIQATLNLELKGVLVALVMMAVTDLVLVALVVAFRGGDVVLARSPKPRSPRGVEDARIVLAAGLAGAAVIHAAVVPEHLDEWLAAGLFFVVLTLAELACAAAVLARDRAWRVPALAAAVVVSAGPLLVWTVSRTTGLPFGPEAWEPEAVGVADVLSCALELTTLTIAVVLLRRHHPARAWSRHVAALALSSVVAATLVGLGGADVPVAGAFSDLGQHHGQHLVVPEG